jgi:hypothetical protein
MSVNPFLSLETNLRKLFDRTGAAFDKLLHGKKDPTAPPSSRELANKLSPSVQKSIDNNIRREGDSVNAPHRVSVLLDYNTFAQLEQTDLSALKKELEQVARDHITNRRYDTESPLTLSITYDPLVATPLVRADFGQTINLNKEAAALAGAGRQGFTPSGRLTLRLRSVNSRFLLDHKIDRLKPGGNPVTVGRGRDNDIIIDDRSVSKFHSTIALTQDGKLIVADVGSSNGTFVNNKAIRNREVVDLGDVITFGDIEVRLEV